MNILEINIFNLQKFNTYIKKNVFIIKLIFQNNYLLIYCKLFKLECFYVVIDFFILPNCDQIFFILKEYLF